MRRRQEERKRCSSRCARGNPRDVRQRFEEAAAENRFAVLGIHDGSAFAPKGCRSTGSSTYTRCATPWRRKKVLDTNVRIGTALPCRVSIYTDGGEVVLETLEADRDAGHVRRAFPSTGPPGEIEAAIEAMMSAAAR